MIVDIILGDVFETKQLYIVFLVPITESNEFVPNFFIGEIEERYPDFKNKRVLKVPGFTIFDPVDKNRALCGIIYNPQDSPETTIKVVGEAIDKMAKYCDIALVITGQDLIQRYNRNQTIVPLLLERLHKSPTKIHLYSNNKYHKYEIPSN